MKPPLLVIDPEGGSVRAIERALAHLEHWRPLMLMPDVKVAQRYLTSPLVRGRTPIAIVVRAHEGDAESLMLEGWTRRQPAPIGDLQVLVISDAISVQPEDHLDAWLAAALRKVLQLPGA